MKRIYYCIVFLLTSFLINNPVLSQVTCGTSGYTNPLTAAREFNVFAKQSVTLVSGHADGSVAMGGNAILNGSYTVAMANSGSHPNAFNNTNNYGLVIGGGITYTSGSSVMVNNGFLRLGSTTGSRLFYTDCNNAASNLRITKNTGAACLTDYQSNPRIELQRQQTSPTATGSNGLDFNTAFTTLAAQSTTLSSYNASAPCSTSLQIHSVGSGNISLTLTANRVNVINLTGTQLNAITQITFNNQPSATQPLVINVNQTSSFSWSSANLASINNASGRFVIFNFYNNTGTVTLTGANTVVGSILVPSGDFTKNHVGNIEGQIVAQNIVLNGGEVHHQPFEACLINCVATCNALTSGGTIASSQQYCASSVTPSSFTSSVNASGGSGGTIKYQWEKLESCGSFVDISGATSSTFSSGSITKTTIFRRRAWRDCSGGTGSNPVYSNEVTVLVVNAGSITGNETGACNFTPTTITGTSIASNNYCLSNGNAQNQTYQWQQSTDGGATWTNISGATSQNFTPGQLQQTTQYRRATTVSSFTCFSNVVTKTVTSGSTVIVNESFPNTFNTGFAAPINTTFTGSTGTWSASSTNKNSTVVINNAFSQSSPNALKLVNYNNGASSTSSTSRAQSPTTNLSSIIAPNTAELNFRLYTYTLSSSNTCYSFNVEFSSDNGSTWTNVYTKTAQELIAMFGSSAWGTIALPIPSNYFNSTFRYRLSGVSRASCGFDSYVYIDDVKIISNSICTPCPTTTNAGANQTNCNNSSFTMAATTAPVGSIGTWSVVSGAATITNANSSTTNVTVTTSPATLRWTITTPNCGNITSDVVLTNTIVTTSNAGNNQTNCNNASFTMAGNAVASGETGVWSVISGAATITTANSPTTNVTVTTSPATLRWTITRGTCTSIDDVILTNTLLTVASAGTDQSKCNNASFTMAANTVASGETGVWSVVSGAATITNVNSPTSNVNVTTSPATLRWTITRGSCTTTDDVILSSSSGFSIGNFVWFDANNNGLQDANETGIANIAVKLYADTDNNNLPDAAAIATTTTTLTGAYAFANLCSGRYIVSVVLPNGYVQGTTTTSSSDPNNSTSNDNNGIAVFNTNEIRTNSINVTSTNNNVDFGLKGILNLGNFVWSDTNDNGIQNAGEPGMAGLTVNLYEDKNLDSLADGAPIATTITDASGNYSFSNLIPGEYIVGVVAPDGYAGGLTTATSHTPNNNNNTDNNAVLDIDGEMRSYGISLTVGGEPSTDGDGANGNLTFDFAFTPNKDLGNCTSGYATTSGGHIVEFLSVTYNGVFPNITSTFSYKVTSGSSPNISHFNFGNLTCQSCMNHSSDFTSVSSGGAYSFGTDPTTGICGIKYDYGINAGQSSTVSFTLAGYFDLGTITFGIKAGRNVDYGPICGPVCTSNYLNLGNLVWSDFNNNGLKDTDEPGIAGITVKLYADANANNVPDGAAIATTTTNASGLYNFANLAPGNYIVGVTLGSYSSTITTISSNSPNNNTDNDNNGVTVVSGELRSNFITLSLGGEPGIGIDGDGTNGNLTLDFGLRGTGVIGNFVWEDLNGNGIQDAGEPGISGVTVTLNGPLGVLTTTTNSNGEYSFTGLVPGTYSVTFTTPNGYAPTVSNVGSNDNIDSDPINGVVSNIVFTAGQSNNTIDAGFYKPLTLGNQVWNDTNNNGLKDPQENGIAGVTVRLYADNNGDNIPDGAAMATTTTDTNGLYTFNNLVPGNYIVGVTIPTGYTSAITTGTSATPNNDIDNDNNGVTVVSGELRSNFITLTSSGEPDTSIDGDGTSSNTTLDFGLRGTLNLGNLVWNDTNGNGIKNTFESGVPNVTVYLYQDANSDNIPDGSAIATATTNASGIYSFNNLAPGNYIVGIVPPTGFAKSFTPTSGLTPNNDTDNDNNGIGTFSGIIRTNFITLTVGGEPASGIDGDGSNGNLTLDIAIAKDTDGDNIPDVIDIDDDNDGITDLNESGGYDPLADCDNDGTPNYLDSTPGCTTPSGNDPWGVPYKPLVFTDCNMDGINDFFDWDRDGIINELDLDSDNDGILDVIEARPNGTAFTSVVNGMITGTDADANGLLSSAENNNSNPVLNGIAAQDMDRDGTPNFLDLDSDGDGITDLTEALGVYSTTGVVSGTDTDGDGVRAENFGSSAAATADNINGFGARGILLQDNDNDGKPNAYDIDSDNDGITDNAEGQATCSYKLPTGNDCDGDGVDDAYDMGGCTSCLRTSGGITPFDKDGDGTPDYIDLDTDNDGSLDIYEGHSIPSANGNVPPINYWVGQLGDTDNDGLINFFDGFNIITATGGSYWRNVINNNMGNNGSFDTGSGSTGSISQLPKSQVSDDCNIGDRDWRNITILPVTLLEFRGNLNNNVAKLVWSVTSEINMNQYQIERSADGINYAVVSTVNANNSNTTSVVSYTANDNLNGFNGSTVYYRLKLVEKNGSYRNSNVISFKLNTIKGSVSIMPNPAISFVNIKVTAIKDGTAAVKIVDMLGKVVMLQNTKVLTGINTFTFNNLSTLSAGTYSVQIMVDGQLFNEKLIVTK